MISDRLVSGLKPHPINSRIYGDSFDKDLLESIKTKGVLNPIIITKDDVIISGHRRFYACQELGLETVPCIESDLTDEDDIKEAIITTNKQREKTNEQKIREFEVLNKVEEVRAKARSLANLKQGEESPDRENFPYRESGKSSDIAAAKVGGISGKTAVNGVKVIKTIDELKADGKEEEAKELTKALNKSVSAALTKIKPVTIESKPPVQKDEFIFTDEYGIIFAKTDNPDYRPVFDEIDIEWAKWSWSPITGCLYECDYCHARKAAESYPKKFSPVFYRNKLQATNNTIIPENRKSELGINNVLVCPKADLFGDWIMSDIIFSIFEACKAAPQFNYFFLTKNPQRYVSLIQDRPKYHYPDNFWLGASVDTKSRFITTYKSFKELSKMEGCPKNSFLVCEPLLENLAMIDNVDSSYLTGDFDTNDFPFSWVVLGGLKDEKAICQPEWSWVENAVKTARAYHAKVYFRPDLTVRPTELPETLLGR